MELFTVHFWTALVSIVLLDLVLAGDNAVVIALAARNLPHKLRNKAILWGTVGAIVIRMLMTLIAVWLLTVPYLQAIGGLILIPIAYHLLMQDSDVENVESSTSLAGAIKTIILADAAMGIDNVLAVAGAAHGDFLLVVVGLLVSVPIVVFGSKGIGTLMDKYPILIYIGAGLIAWTAGSMVVHDKSIGMYLTAITPMMNILVPAVLTVGILAFGIYKKKNVVE